MKKLLALAATAAVITATNVSAEDSGHSERPVLLTFSTGSFEPFNTKHDEVAFGAEYVFAPVAWGVVRPVVGGFANTDSGLYGYAGVDFDFKVADKIYVIPGVAAGLYDEGNGKDLGGALQFRSSIEIAYEFNDASRIGLALAHISNAGTHSNNPGAETLMLTYSMPIR